MEGNFNGLRSSQKYIAINYYANCKSITLFTVAMKSGVCWSFGSNSEGQLGAGRGAEWSHTPVPWQLEGGAGGVVKLGAGAGHSLALTGAGEVWGWGANTEGQLGLGPASMETVFTPTRLPLSDQVTHGFSRLLTNRINSSDKTLFSEGFVF